MRGRCERRKRYSIHVGALLLSTLSRMIGEATITIGEGKGDGRGHRLC